MKHPKRQTHTERKSSGHQRLGGQSGRWRLLSGYKFFFWGDENVLELERHDVVQHCECTNATELYTLR